MEGVQKLERVKETGQRSKETGKPGVKGLLSVDTIAKQHYGWAASQLRRGACIVSATTLRLR